VWEISEGDHTEVFQGDECFPDPSSQPTPSKCRLKTIKTKFPVLEATVFIRGFHISGYGSENIEVHDLQVNSWVLKNRVINEDSGQPSGDSEIKLLFAYELLDQDMKVASGLMTANKWPGE
jgi:hypothetical protein